MGTSAALIRAAKRLTRRCRATSSPAPGPAASRDPAFALWGGNARAYESAAPEVLTSGPAGTGKSAGHLFRLYWTCRLYPGARCLIVRKTRESLTETVLVTWERDILGPDHPVLARRPILRRVRQSYDFPNGSVVVLGGMDKPDKILSSEWDVVYAPEALELSVTDWETLGGRLRSGKVPAQQIVADCNPGTPTHWLYKRAGSGLGGGLCTLFPTTHRDNPRYWSRGADDWTVAGRQYLDRLGRMTGHRRKRFLDGVWAAAEGLVYDGFHPAVHLLPAGWEPPAGWRRAWSIDWGFTNPSVLGMWAIDGDGRAYLYREFYRTHTRAEELARWAKRLLELGEPVPEVVLCDHDPECKATFELYSGLSVSMADKRDKDIGIEATQARFDVQDDGRPRIFFRPDARDGPPDDALLAAGKPTSTAEELTGYVWDTRNPDRLKDEPLDRDNHGADQMRYFIRWAEDHASGQPFGYDPNPPPADDGRFSNYRGGSGGWFSRPENRG